MQAYVIYHLADMDGYAGGAICYRKLTELGYEVEMIPFNYGMDLSPIEAIPDGSKVIMVDLSIPMPNMKELNDRTKFIWLDHHTSSLKDAEEANFNPQGNYQIGTSGCELAWEYFYPAQSMPYLINMLGRFDVWDLSVGPPSFWVNTHLYGKNLKPGIKNAARWEQIFTEDKVVVDPTITKEKTLEYGKLLYEFQLEIWEKETKSKCFEMEFRAAKTHSVLACNGGKGSTFFHAMNPEKYDILMVFAMNKERKVNYSVYTLHGHIDVSLVAGFYGGGGHRGAAGFQSDKFPWDLDGMFFKD